MNDNINNKRIIPPPPPRPVRPANLQRPVNIPPPPKEIAQKVAEAKTEKKVAPQAALVKPEIKTTQTALPVKEENKTVPHKAESMPVREVKVQHVKHVEKKVKPPKIKKDKEPLNDQSKTILFGLLGGFFLLAGVIFLALMLLL
ncbi:MAG: hypothetical protein IJY90_01960 [Clostridia bacterium]|nr:hypothetical protein [Clostridia bacterium]